MCSGVIHAQFAKRRGTDIVTVVDLMKILRTAEPLARVTFLPWGADEDGVEEVDAVRVPERKWIRETYFWKGQECKALHQEGPCTDLPLGSENAVVESVSVVILSVDVDFLSSRQFI
ncbi:hypothetical protein AXG89_07680 [Burkholderia sp. PAMC 26561]|nr:hypothetical protein AXG89_07680 [Burkholderia sp. PAMC 26561]